MSETRAITDAEWELHKKAIENLYQTKTLLEVVTSMEQDYGFIAKLVSQISNKSKSKLTQVQGKLNTPENLSNGTFRKIPLVMYGSL